MDYNTLVLFYASLVPFVIGLIIGCMTDQEWKWGVYGKALAFTFTALMVVVAVKNVGNYNPDTDTLEFRMK